MRYFLIFALCWMMQTLIASPARCADQQAPKPPAYFPTEAPSLPSRSWRDTPEARQQDIIDRLDRIERQLDRIEGKQLR